MQANLYGSLFTRMRKKFLDWRVNREIFNQMFPHYRGEKDYGYASRTIDEMSEETDEFNVQTLFDTIEQQIRKMPRAYGVSFRHIMHRELHERLSMYEHMARRRVPPTWCDPRHIATHA